MKVVELLAGINPANDKWTRRRCAAELRRLAEAGRLGRRNLGAIRRNWHDTTFATCEHLMAAVIVTEHPGRIIAKGWAVNRLGTYFDLEPLRVRP